MLKKLKNSWRDLSLILSVTWLNLTLFLVLVIIGASLLKFFGMTPQPGWPQAFLYTFYMTLTEGVDTKGQLLPILLAFLLPLGTILILGEGVVRVFSIYILRRVNRREWDLMLMKDLKDHTVICGVGEMGRQLVKKLLAERADTPMVLIDPRPGVLAEMGLNGTPIIHFQSDMADVDTLEKANIGKAARVVLTAGEDALNLEVTYMILQLNPNVPIWVRLHHSGLANLLELSHKPNVHFFCPYEYAADAIMDHIMEREPNTPTEG
jgi:FlaA1/EpsC-like NDP-sugar epimerase